MVKPRLLKHCVMSLMLLRCSTMSIVWYCFTFNCMIFMALLLMKGFELTNIWSMSNWSSRCWILKPWGMLIMCLLTTCTLCRPVVLPFKRVTSGTYISLYLLMSSTVMGQFIILPCFTNNFSEVPEGQPNLAFRNRTLKNNRSGPRWVWWSTN